MKRSLLLLSVTTLLAACQAGGNSTDDASAVDVAADEQAIRGQVANWLDLIKAKDSAAISHLYTDDGAVMPPNGPIGKGHEAIEAAWAGMLAIPGFDLNFVPDQIVVSASGDMALDRGTYTLGLAPAGTAMTDTGKYVVVWRKVDGEWKAAADIFNSDLPAGGG